MKEPPVGAPEYMSAETCIECWEPFGGFDAIPFIDRFIHRRKWGHNPAPLHRRQTEQEMHAEKVRGAQARKSETPPPPALDTDPGVQIKEGRL